MKYTLLAVTLLFFQNLFAQQTVQVFEPDIISSGGQFGLTISPDSKTAFWVYSNGARDTLQIMQSVKRNGKWQKPVTAVFSTRTAAWKDIDPMFTPDGKTVLFQSNRAVPGKPDRKGFDIWASHLTKDGWSEAVHLGNVINSDSSESYASATRKGDVYFMKSNEDGKGLSDIYVSRFVKGSYQTPINIGAPVNTTARESNPFISAKGDYIIYFSSDPKGLGEVDLYISFYKNGKWSEPKNLDAPINSADAEFCPFVHEKEKRLYFSRQKKIPGSSRMVEQLVWIPFDVNSYRN
ncbi:MAG: hypothetical protein GXC73_04855 [Chitinophagaceae bacterium]|nr:hypothetical protein [Chitinophagaceae bacterium]